MVVADMETNGDQVRSQPQHDEQKKAHVTAEVATTVRESSRNMNWAEGSGQLVKIAQKK